MWVSIMTEFSYPTLAEDSRDISRKHRIDPMDVTRVVTLLIMADAQYAAEKDVKAALDRHRKR